LTERTSSAQTSSVAHAYTARFHVVSARVANRCGLPRLCTNTVTLLRNRAGFAHGNLLVRYTGAMVLRYNEMTVAEVHADASVAYAGWILDLGQTHPISRFVRRMVEYAVDIRQHDGRDATQPECEVYARASLVPARAFGLPRRIGDRAAAERWGLPVDQLVLARADYGYDEHWNRQPAITSAPDRPPGGESRRRRH
jgi:hypothetical protein